MSVYDKELCTYKNIVLVKKNTDSVPLYVTPPPLKNFLELEVTKFNDFYKKNLSNYRYLSNNIS